MVDDVTWVRFDWKLSNIAPHLALPAKYEFRSAIKHESDAISRLVVDAYASDPIWMSSIEQIKRRMTERIGSTIGVSGFDYLVVESSTSIVAVSGVAKIHWTDQNLLTGICVLPPHQKKGLGRFLLNQSLLKLRDWGLASARVYTELDSLADRKLYPLYGSTRLVGVAYPGAKPEIT